MGPKISREKKTRNFDRTRAAILKVAFLEVYTKGFQGVSVDDIISKTDLTKGAFYHHFPTKLELGYALVEDVITPMIIERWINPLKDYQNPLEGVLAQMKKLIGDKQGSSVKYGCPLNNLAQEMTPVDEGFKTRLQAAFNLWIIEMEKQIRRAKAAGYIKKDVNPRQVAQFVIMCHEGFYGIIKGSSQPRMFDALFASLKIYFETITNRK